MNINPTLKSYSMIYSKDGGVNRFFNKTTKLKSIKKVGTPPLQKKHIPFMLSEDEIKTEQVRNKKGKLDKNDKHIINKKSGLYPRLGQRDIRMNF